VVRDKVGRPQVSLGYSCSVLNTNIIKAERCWGCYDTANHHYDTDDDFMKFALIWFVAARVNCKCISMWRIYCQYNRWWFNHSVVDQQPFLCCKVFSCFYFMLTIFMLWLGAGIGELK